MPLSRGHIAFVGFNTDGNDNIAFAALDNIGIGETIIFEDNEWDGSGWVDTGEGAFSWTSTSLITAGTIVRIDNVGAGTITASTGTVTQPVTGRGASRGLANSGESLYAYQGSAAAPTFITAISNNAFTNISTGLLTGTGLTAGVNAIALSGDVDIAAYNGSRSGQSSFADYRSLINNAANWQTEDGSGDQSRNSTAPDVPFSSTAFTIAAINNAPVLGFSTSPLSYSENAVPLRIDSSASLSDLDTPASYAGGTLTARIASGGLASDRLGISAINGISLDGRMVRFNSLEIGSFSGGSFGPTAQENLVVSLNANATQSAVTALLQALNYSSVGEDLPAIGSRTVEVSLHEADSTTSNLATRTINVTGSNDSPFIGRNLLLYGGTGSPADQGWTNLNTSLSGSPIITNASNGVTVSTIGNVATNFGYGIGDFSNPSVLLNAIDGYVVQFNVQVINETFAASANKNNDGKNDRAGFSLLVVSSDPTRAIELGFWTNQIWAQEDGTSQVNPALEPDESGNPSNFRTLFTQAESATFDTTTAKTYQLAVQGNTYTLMSGGSVILSGRLRNYTAFNKLPDVLNPYRRPNFLYFGDNTSSASGNFTLGAVSLITNPTTLSPLTVDEEAIQTITGLAVGDRDAGNAILTVSLSVNQGRITVNDSVPNGITIGSISSNHSSSVTLTGTIHQINTTLADPNGLRYQGNLNFAGNDSLTITVNDGGAAGGAAQTASKTIAITVNNVNDAAVIGDPTVSSVTEDANVTHGNLTATGTLSISDGDAGQAAFKTSVAGVQGNLGSLVLTANGSYSYSVANSAVQFLGAGQTRVDAFTVEAIDGTTKQIRFTITGTNDAPALTGNRAVLVSGTEDNPYIINAHDLLAGFFDAENDPLSVNNLTASNGSLVNHGNGTYTLTPNANFHGSVGLSYSVTDGKGGSIAAAQSFTLAARNDAPTVVSAIANQTAVEETAFIFQIPAGTFADVDGDPLTYTATLADNAALPDWLKFNAATLTFNGTPTIGDANTLNLKITAKDGNGGSVSSLFVLDVTQPRNATTKDIFGTPNPDGNLRGTSLGESIYGLAGDDVLYGLDGADNLYGGSGNDILRGGNQNDVLYGNEGNDTLFGDAGNDILLGGLGNDILRGGDENDQLRGEAGIDSLFGDAGDDRLHGGDDNDILRGGDGNDQLIGESGTDSLFGDANDDVLNGGAGADVLTGGGGSDTFVLVAGQGADTITDFAIGQDKIQLQGMSYSELRFVQSGTSTLIQVNGQMLVTFNQISRSDLLLAANFVP